MLSTLIYIYFIGAIAVTGIGSYGCYSGKFSGNQVAIGLEGPLCYGVVAGVGVAWPVVGGYFLMEMN